MEILRTLRCEATIHITDLVLSSDEPNGIRINGRRAQAFSGSKLLPRDQPKDCYLELGQPEVQNDYNAVRAVTSTISGHKPTTRSFKLLTAKLPTTILGSQKASRFPKTPNPRLSEVFPIKEVPTWAPPSKTQMRCAHEISISFLSLASFASRWNSAPMMTRLRQGSEPWKARRLGMEGGVRRISRSDDRIGSFGRGGGCLISVASWLAVYMTRMSIRGSDF
jgi:hypothetical protein